MLSSLWNLVKQSSFHHPQVRTALDTFMFLQPVVTMGLVSIQV